MALLIGILIVAGIIAVGSILNGFVLSILWGWFVVPYFHQPALPVALAIGLALTVSQLVPRVHCKTDDDSGLSTVFIAPFLTLIIGWVVHFFV